MIREWPGRGLSAKMQDVYTAWSKHAPGSWECYLGKSGQGTEGNDQGWRRMDGAEVPRFSLEA